MSETSPEPQADTATATDASRLSRRRALKAAVATGVGVAAWSVPSIRSLGGTPVYADACSASVVWPLVEDKNGNINCSDACADRLSFGWLGKGNTSRNVELTAGGTKYTGSVTFGTPIGGVSVPPACSDQALPVTVVFDPKNGVQLVNCQLVGIIVEAINNFSPGIPGPDGTHAPLIAEGWPAPIALIGNPYVVTEAYYIANIDPAWTLPPGATSTGYVWIGVHKNGGIGNICSSQWKIVVDCDVIGCPV